MTNKERLAEIRGHVVLRSDRYLVPTDAEREVIDLLAAYDAQAKEIERLKGDVDEQHKLKQEACLSAFRQASQVRVLREALTRVQRHSLTHLSGDMEILINATLAATEPTS